jgi:hypothetical protein
MFKKYTIFILLFSILSSAAFAEGEEEDEVVEPTDGIEIFHEEDEALANVNFTNITYQENYYERSRNNQS